jgi:hypothetical protein
MDEHWTHSYRMRPYFRNVGVVCTAGFLAMGVVSTTVAYFNVDGSFPNPKLAALIFGLFWSAWCLLGVWLIVAYYRYRLFANHNGIQQIGVVRHQFAPIIHIHELRWRPFPSGGSVRLAGLFGVLKIELGLLAQSQRQEFVSFLRTAVDSSRQIGWETFDEQFNQQPVARNARSRRAAIALAIFFIAIGIGFLVAWCCGLGNVNLVASPINIVFGAYLLLKSKHDGKSPMLYTGDPSAAPKPPKGAL